MYNKQSFMNYEILLKHLKQNQENAEKAQYTLVDKIRNCPQTNRQFCLQTVAEQIQHDVELFIICPNLQLVYEQSHNFSTNTSSRFCLQVCTKPKYIREIIQNFNKNFGKKVLRFLRYINNTNSELFQLFPVIFP